MLVNGIHGYKIATQYDAIRAALYNWKQRLLWKCGIVQTGMKANFKDKNPVKKELETDIADLH